MIALTSSQILLLCVFLPYMGFALGFGLLAWAMTRRSVPRLPATLLALAGILLTIGGIASSKLILISAALALLAFTLRWIWDEAREQAASPLAPGAGALPLRDR